MNGETYFSKSGFSINEGGTPLNVHISWNRPFMGYRFYFYIYLFGKRFYFFINTKENKKRKWTETLTGLKKPND